MTLEDRVRIQRLEESTRLFEESGRQLQLALSSMLTSQALFIERMDRMERKMDEMPAKITADIMQQVKQLLKREKIGFVRIQE